MRSCWRVPPRRDAAASLFEAADHPFVDRCAFLLDSRSWKMRVWRRAAR